jgi:endonuclease III
MRQRYLAFGGRPDLPEIRDRLLQLYGSQRDDKRFNPLSQLIYGVVASRTRDDVSMAAFLRLRACCPSWGELIETPSDVIECAIQGVTFAEKKAVDLPITLLMLEKRHGLDLEFLADLDEETAMQYLTALHGVGPKIAATVLNFSSLRKRALAVDTHLLRVGERLGIVPPEADYRRGHDSYAALLPEEWDADALYEFHWLVKKFGQDTCRQPWPDCAACPLGDICPSRGTRPAAA